MNFKIWLKEGPLDDPEHVMFGDFDHIPWLKNDIKHYAKMRQQGSGPLVTTTNLLEQNRQSHPN